MKRRTILLGLGSASAGVSTLVGSTAFSDARARRDGTIGVVPDSTALVGLGRCPDEDAESTAAGAYLVEEGGRFAIRIDERNDALLGDGVNERSVHWFDAVFEVCNRTDRPVCFDFGLDVPTVPGPVPPEYDFEAGDDTVVFYEGDDRSATIDISAVDARDSPVFSLGPGECRCLGFTVRTFGFEAGTDVLGDATLTIRTFAGDDCATEDGTPGDGGSGDGEDGDGGDDDGLDGLTAISFVAFCPGTGEWNDSGSVTVTDVTLDDDGELVALEWNADTPVGEVVLKAGTEWYRCDADGATEGTVIPSADASRFGPLAADARQVVAGPQVFRFDDDPADTGKRCPASPCLAEFGLKLEADDGFDVPVVTKPRCNGRT